MRSVIKRIRQHLIRRHAAAALGFDFRSSASFRVPSHVRVMGTKKEVQIPADHGSKIAFIEVLLDDCYGLRAFPDQIGAVLDIGAHVGLFSVAARTRFPGAQVHAYEPNARMHPFLARQSEIAGFSFFGEAVGLREGRVTLDLGEDSVQTRVIYDPQSAIKCTAFAEAIARLSRAPILVKLDCEGTEWEILHDAAAWQSVRYLTMEYHLWAGYTLVELTQQIEAMGFAIKSLSDTEADFGILTAQRRQ